MKASLITALVSVTAGLVSADGCFNNGGLQGDPKSAEAAISPICSLLVGNYKPLEIRSKCSSSPSKRHWNYKIQRSDKEVGNMTQNMCEDAMTRQVKGCRHYGGILKLDGWQYT
jgi:hypothetical protein